MDILSKLKKAGIVVGVLVVILGLVILIFPAQTLKLIDVIVGTALIVAGVLGIYKVLKDPNIVSGKFVKTLPGILLILLAIYLLVWPVTTLYMCGIFVGAFALVACFQNVTSAIALKKAGEPISSFVLMAIINFIFAIGMFSASLLMFVYMLMFIGAYAVCLGVMIIISSAKMKHINKEA